MTTITTDAPSPAMPEVEIRDCRLSLGMAGQDRIEFHLPELLVQPGERIALTGPSGCGKTTLLNVISGLLTPQEGQVRVHGSSFRQMRAGQRDVFRGRNIGFIYQTFNLLEGFTALENVLLGMRFGRTIEHSHRTDHATQLLERVGLARRIHLRPSRLSAGERQRVAIARAIANRPSLLLADEPTGSLDPATGNAVFDLIQEISEEEGRTLLFVTHDLDLASRFALRFDCRDLVVHAPIGAGPS